jgi:hypothetical protein
MVFPGAVKGRSVSDSFAGCIYGDLIRHGLRPATRGTRLGFLVIARNMIGAHGGDLCAVSEREASFLFSVHCARRR